VPVEELRLGDLFVVKPGDSIPADGIIRQGESAINESALTGESIPMDKSVGDSVSAATINLSGHLVCEATGVGENTTLAKIIDMVSEAASTKAPIAKVANQVSAIFVPAVLVIALVTFIIWLLAGESFGFAIARGISVLVVSCPCALGLATPVAIMVGNGVGARNGILFKTAESLEETGKTKIVVLDKTGTITSGNPEVTDVDGENQEELLKIAYALERKSEHPLGKAIVRYGEEKNLPKEEPEQFRILPGNGLTGTLNGKTVFGGNLAFAKTFGDVDSSILQRAEAFAEQGKTPLFFGHDDTILGIIAVADTVKETSKTAISELKEMGIRVVMLTGDNPKTAAAIASQVGIDEVVAGVLPDGKQAAVYDLKQSGKVMMVGDGINDAPALTSADIGIAIGAGTDIAIDAADVVLMKNSLADIPATIRLSRSTLRNIRQNLFWAFCYNIIGIPLAAGAFIPLWGWRLNPMFGAIAMSVSDFLVVTNALRLNLCKLYSLKPKGKEVHKMEKTFKVEGMMCPHCEARVTEKLLELDGVSSVIASHQEKSVVVTLEKDVPDALITGTITDQGYQVL
ncbi:MAG: heavy metal translocating P-type ATPase, partial [Clostridia bacterium]|nr:heavy metal translocating P-type ATPase [Clostridia bacterium]